MAIIHISEEEAARDLSSVLAKVRAGERVQIDSNEGSFEVSCSEEVTPPKTRTLSEAIRFAEECGFSGLLDDKWSEDLEAVIRSHEHETGRNAWE